MVDVGFACFGIDVLNGRVVGAPPIARWMIGKDGAAIDRYVRGKGGTITEVPHPVWDVP